MCRVDEHGKGRLIDGGEIIGDGLLTGVKVISTEMQYKTITEMQYKTIRNQSKYCFLALNYLC
jgi:hypothetical protein